MTTRNNDSVGGPLLVRPASTRDRSAVFAMNNASTPNVNVLRHDQFDWLATESDFYRVVERNGELAGFAMAFRAGKKYWSANYAWFAERYDDFIYLDRIVVAPEAQRHGVGTLLYRTLVEFSKGQWPRIAIEVNVQPPNPGSIAFHQALGFQQVGSRRDGEHEVAMFVLAV